MSAYNTKAEGHKGEAARLELMAQQLLMPAAQRKELAAELRAKAQVHWEKAQAAEGFDQLVADVETHLGVEVVELDEVEALLEPAGQLWESEGGSVI